ILKWNPHFLNNFLDHIAENAVGQPVIIHHWIELWAKVSTISPHTIAIFVAVIETLIAISLISGVLARPAIIVGAIFSFLIWSTAEGFGGPYGAASTDVGASIVYVFVFLALYFGESWKQLKV
ncbi:MAG: nitrite reductase, partial [Patescibacteria group bacterium]|nr:nitrite reductase [Patescibacteria group bacterium]